MNTKAALATLGSLAAIALLYTLIWFFPGVAAATMLIALGGAIAYFLTRQIYRMFKKKFESHDGRSLPVRD